MGFKKMLIGEKMPDKNDPRYRERYEREVAAGRRFADVSGISTVARKIHVFGTTRPKLFLVIVFGIVMLLFVVNAVHLFKVYQQRPSEHVTAVERMEKVLKEKKSLTQHKYEKD